MVMGFARQFDHVLLGNVCGNSFDVTWVFLRDAAG